MFQVLPLEFLALVGLFVQAFVAWILLAVLASLGRRVHGPDAFRSFRRALAGLAVGLTAMSLRFLRAHPMDDLPAWSEESWPTRACYAVYMATRAGFALYLLDASFRLAGRWPPWVGRCLGPAAAVCALIPLFGFDIDDLLVILTPLIVACALGSAHVLGVRHRGERGLRIVRTASFGLAASWAVHATAILFGGAWAYYWLSLNSYVDLAVQLALGIGLVVSQLEREQRLRIEAEREREVLRRSIEQDQRLRALGTAVSGVAHELNNPLTAILGYADLLRNERDDERARILFEQAQRCRGIVRNLSALAVQTVHPRERIDLVELCERVRRGIAPAPDDDCTVAIDVPPGTAVTADRIGLEQVLANLLSNAQQAAGPGGRVHVAAREGPHGVDIEVTDSGPGVPRELRGCVFEPFFTTRGPGTGTGLGLSIAHAIVRSHGGTIRVEDGAPGARFVVHLPERPSPPPTGVARPTLGGGGTLLVVDDEPAVRSVLAAQACARGWHVVQAATAEEALAGTPEHADAILCDLRMPGIGGPGFFDRIRSEAPELLERTVFATGDLASRESGEFRERCGRPLLEKPFDLDELFTVLERVRRGRRGLSARR